jgi:hypothetical protein
VGVVAGGDEKLAGDFGADADAFQQCWRGGPDKCGEVSVGVVDLLAELLVAAGETTK